MVELQLRSRGIDDERVLAAFARVPRHEFVAPKYGRQAYEDHPIPIGENQTISQPYIVAITLQALALQPEDRALDVGTGSGYQTALLAELVREVFSIERYEGLAQAAQQTLTRLDYSNVSVAVGDGTQGLPEHAPYNAIAVSAAAPQIPPPLFEQLAEGGRMVIPVGPAYAQQLQLVQKIDGRMVVTGLEACRFVPLIGSEGYGSGW
jgi:protein-L-isoaspartate(D-aspartate) O-methyltransferase